MSARRLLVLALGAAVVAGITAGSALAVGHPTPHSAGTTPFELYTHYGIHFTTFAGRYWETLTALPDPQPVPNAQGVTTYTGYISGSMTLVDPNTLRFAINDPAVSITGQVVVFRPKSAPPPLCD
jgi:hypothetical protein